MVSGGTGGNCSSSLDNDESMCVDSDFDGSFYSSSSTGDAGKNLSLKFVDRDLQEHLRLKDLTRDRFMDRLVLNKMKRASSPSPIRSNGRDCT
eukprot:CAMPEP_0116874600 /NCGR_PEP_ID=MMETSP0463-20121206/6083_1 /TAXON_ID=181622 /ORGANISM="Strombidinopsis sp, Strain SopsisLIS2011" /LENGTH=92 /DNA_ID=CAMNT_0004518449 /DNA_START=450 /DNA_END=728 /DNA_ORIENTATION=-